MTSYDIKTDKKKAIEVAKVYSPMEFVTSNAVPTLIMHGTKDFVVPFKQSKKLKKALDQNNVDNKFDLTLLDRKSTRLNSSHVRISYAVFCLKKKKIKKYTM